MKLGLTSLLLTLLILGGCSKEPTELERCIEANTEETNYWERYWESWKSIVDKFTEEEKKDYAESLKYPDWVWSEEEAIPKNDQDQRMLNCFNEKFDVEAFDTNFAKSKNITVEEVKTSEVLDKALWNEYLDAWFKELDKTCGHIIESHSEDVLKLCHSQGIY